ncbi:hypothetical protein [uncultured Jannaschia sp.]|uniref:hypothetical protein n=1 Tax=uncultured Jannaschia sp. TaxID=293347 RepID=UPI002632479A|nr:hypothetical protein [uncultured Jannaschia sp.]
MDSYRYLFIIVALSVGPAPTFAQSAIEAFRALDEAAQQEGVSDAEIAEFEQILNGSDEERARRAMDFMLASDDPRLVRRAKEFGLFSANALFRDAALRAIFDEGGPFQIEIDLTAKDDEETGMVDYINALRGGFSQDGETGYFTFALDAYDEADNCWPFNGYNNCAFMLANSAVSLAGWSNGKGQLTLNSEGALEGTLQYTSGIRKPAPARIVLIE